MANVSQLCAIHHFHLSRNSNGLEKKFDSRNPFLRRSSNRLRIECNLIEREKEKLKNERGGRSKKERERYEGRIPRREMVSGACLVYRGVVESKPLAKVIEISHVPVHVDQTILCGTPALTLIRPLTPVPLARNSVWVRADSSYRNGSDRLLEVLKWYRTRFWWEGGEG